MSFLHRRSFLSRYIAHRRDRHIGIAASLVVVAAEAVTTEAVLEVAVRLLLLRVVLVVAAVVLVVELLGVLPGLTLGLLAVDEVGTLSLGEAVDFTASEAGEELLGELVGDGLAC